MFCKQYRYPPVADRFAGDRFGASDRYAGDRFGVSDRYPSNGYGKDRSYERDIPPPPRAGSDRYGIGGPARDEGRGYRSRLGPYDRPPRGDRPSSFDRY